MNIGMLWFDNDPHTQLADKVISAAEYYQRKYGLKPNLCLVHPSMLTGHIGMVQRGNGKVFIRSNRSIQPGHLWIGMKEYNEN